MYKFNRFTVLPVRVKVIHEVSMQANEILMVMEIDAKNSKKLLELAKLVQT